ncbi:MAG: chromosome segregation protein SMC [Methanomassiliicoccales archaeon]|nr:chromosome segregation protein SMC [Methanomassiliicoccales archaeon]
MFLKQIELENFKSFGKKLTIPLLEGYTAVTGPNGSGKSNISDAILFVLGPKSSRAIRAGKLTDLIFNGGNSKQPAKYTKVSLIFDNKDRLIPIDSDTVKLTRLVKLSDAGDGYNSYFYVNDRKSTLTEFESLLSHARISADGYNFVQQGDVTKIVEMSNIERRRILDDISGISRYDEEIAKAENERKEAEQNIERITIIMNELEKQIEQLKGERESALKYLEIKNTLSLSKAQLAHKRRESVLTEIDSIKSQIEQYNREFNDHQLRKDEISKKINEMELRIKEIEDETSKKGGESFKELKEKIDFAKIQIARLRDQAERALESTKEIEESLQTKKEEREQLSPEVERLESELKNLDSQLQSRSELLSSKKQALEEIQNRVGAFDEELQSLKQKISSLEEEIKAKEENLHALSMERERLEEKKSRIESEISLLEESRKSLEFEINDAEWNIKTLRSADKDSVKEIKALQEQYLSKKNLESKLSRQADELEQAIQRLTREYNHLKAEQEALESVAKGYTRAVRSILEARDRRELKGIHGTIAELAEVDEKYQTALNVAAGARMQSIVVDDDEVAAQAIEYLKKNNLGRAIFLPLNKMLDGKPRGKAILAEKESLGYAIDLVKFDEKYRPAFWYVFGDTVVMETLEKARRFMGGVRLVTLEGELLEASGAMIGGTIEGTQVKFGSASKSKLDEIGEELRKATDEAEKVGEELRKVRAELIEIENRIRELNSAGGANDVRLKALESRKEEIKARLLKVRSDLEARRKEKEEVEKSLTSIAEKIDQLTKEIAEAVELKEQEKKKMCDLAPMDLSKELKNLQGEVVELINEVSELRSQKEAISGKLHVVRRRVEDLDAMEAEAKEKIEKLTNEAKEATEKEQQFRVELTALLKIEDSMGKEINELREKRDALFKEKTNLEAEKDKLQSKIETIKDFSVGLTTKLSVAEDKLKEIDEEIKQYNVQIVYPLPSSESLKEKISSCERQLASMGAVNLKAIEDYDAKKARYDELKSEIQRLEDQRRDLLKLMADLNEKKKMGLLKVYEAVNENFKRMYAELSGGGEAELVLENPEDPFQGGLVIRAKPKNGKTLRLEALSGGEKSLTALAFIFAIQEYQPSPLYLLDEVDMFLDAVNADTVAHRIQRASKTAQFIQISLRKVTLNKADHIIGVTKQEGGTSTVIMRPNIGDIADFHEDAAKSNGNTAEGVA